MIRSMLSGSLRYFEIMALSILNRIESLERISFG